MYQQYFGLAEQPFSIAVNPRYLFMSSRHRDALAHLLYGVGSGGGFILLTGEVGTGKTTLNRCLLEQLPEQTDIAIVLNPALSAIELLATVCDEFDIDYPQGTDSLKILTDALHQFLLRNHQANRRTVLMIDEAQHLDFTVLEQIRLLTNLETDEKKLLQIILTGQPELAAMLARPELRQLNQRITARFDLTPLSADETRTYIQHRLEIAGLGSGREIFSPSAVREVYQLSGGVPRLVNLLCDRAMLGAYGRQDETVSARLVREAATEVLGGAVKSAAAAGNAGSALTWQRALIGIVFMVLAAGLWMTTTDDAPYIGTLATPSETAPEPLNAAGETVTDPMPPEDAQVLRLGDLPIEGIWNLRATDASAAMWALWDEARLAGDLCMAAVAQGLRCEETDAEVWDAVLAINRPAMLPLRRADGFAGATVLLDITDNGALLWTGTAICTVPLSELTAAWRGGSRYLWRPPEGWTGPLTEGATGPIVTQVVAAFARLDGVPAPPLAAYTEALVERVRAFQAEVGLEVDGVIGVRTLLALSDRLGDSLSLAAGTQRAMALSEGRSCP